MTSGSSILLRAAATVLLLTSLLKTGRAGELDASTLIRGLEKPAPAIINFKELRLSALLDQPLIVSGVLRYLAVDHLERVVQQPYLEKTVIRGGSVRVERDGEKLRTFALKRAPELQGLLSAFGALLTGDSAAVEKNFQISARDENQGWELTLVPRDTRARQHIAEIVVMGFRDQPSCLIMGKPGSSQSIMLFGDYAHRPLPSELSIERLESTCRNESPSQ